MSVCVRCHDYDILALATATADLLVGALLHSTLNRLTRSHVFGRWHRVFRMLLPPDHFPRPCSRRERVAAPFPLGELQREARPKGSRRISTAQTTLSSIGAPTSVPL